MRTLDQRFPAPEAVFVEALLERLQVSHDLAFGDRRMLDYWGAVSEQLLAEQVRRRHPELVALGFYLRPAHLQGVLETLHDAAGRVRTPVGLVLHVAPGNVDATFAYSWALSALAGNVNIVRISQRAGAATSVILDACSSAATRSDPAVAATQAVVTYPVDAHVTDALSSACDLRVVWGGDDAVREVRRSPLPARARDLTFPDRTSCAVISARGWSEADEATRAGVVAALYDDVYNYDQAACSSPQTLYWVGSTKVVQRAHREFAATLGDYVGERRPHLPPELTLHTRTSAYTLAATGAATSMAFPSPALTWVELAGPGVSPQRWLGTGILPWARLDGLTELAECLDRRCQTVVHAGFEAKEVAALAEALPARVVDRIVPVGSALDFTEVWDGYELVREFSALRTVSK